MVCSLLFKLALGKTAGWGNEGRGWGLGVYNCISRCRCPPGERHTWRGEENEQVTLTLTLDEEPAEIKQ